MNSPDASQQAVIDAVAVGGLIVTAGPGSGKTFTAALRASRLIEEVEDGLPILAVSFSRAAAHAIRQSCWQAECRTGIRFATLDGWARGFVAQSGDMGVDGPNFGNFEAIIEQATAILRTKHVGDQLHSHLLVDEAQDISGVRRELVRELMERTSMGWTLLGDLAQKIFDFDSGSTDDRVRQSAVAGQGIRQFSVPSFVLPAHFAKVLECVPEDARDEVLENLRSMQGADAERTSEIPRDEAGGRGESSRLTTYGTEDELSLLEEMIGESLSASGIMRMDLTEDHRSKSPDLRALRSLGSILRDDTATEATVNKLWNAHRDLRRAVNVQLGEGKQVVDDLSGMLRVWSREAGSTAVLVKSRADLLSMSRHLSTTEIVVPHEIIPTRDEELVPAWVGGLAGAGSVEELHEKIPESLNRGVLLPMFKTRFVRGNRFDEEAVVESLRTGRVPEFLRSRVFAGVLLSTIHRVKGLEFDRVVLGKWAIPEESSRMLNESRLMFVGLTRASSENWALDFRSGDNFGLVPKDRSRRVETKHLGRSSVNVGIEVKSSDVRLIRPVPDSVSPVLHLDTNRPGSPPRYVLGDADGSQIYGFTLDRFGEAVEVTATGKKGTVPTQLNGLIRVGTCTIAPDNHQRDHWNGSKLAVAPVFAGIVRWKKG